MLSVNEIALVHGFTFYFKCELVKTIFYTSLNESEDNKIFIEKSQFKFLILKDCFKGLEAATLFSPGK